MKWILPWKLSKDIRSSDDMPIILENLEMRGYSVSRFRKPPPPSVEKMCINLLELINKRMKDGKIPWVLAISNDSVGLQLASQIVPIVWALTKAEAVFTTDTDFIFRTFVKDLEDTDPFGEDYAGQVLDDIKSSALLWWKSIGEGVAGTNKYKGRFVQIVDYRIEWGLGTVFTHRYAKKFESYHLAQLWSEIESSFGEGFSGSLEDYCAIRIYKSSSPVVADIKELEL